MKTDNQLKQDVKAELEWEPSIHASEIGVEVTDGIVTLTSHVGIYAEKLRAEHAAQRVAGVKALAVEIDVTLPGPSKRTDADIARTLDNVSDWLSVLPKNSVKAILEDGWITLSGQVNWQYQLVATEAAVRYLMGVKGASNQIVIKFEASSTTVKSDIEAALKRSAHTDKQNISVDVCGADVTLSGEVNRWAERDLARNSAWHSPGIRPVIDNMTVPS